MKPDTHFDPARPVVDFLFDTTIDVLPSTVSAPILFYGRLVSPAGAALAGGMTSADSRKRRSPSLTVGVFAPTRRSLAATLLVNTR